MPSKATPVTIVKSATTNRHVELNKTKHDGSYSPGNVREKWRILKNVFVIAIAFMLHFTAFFGISNLQSSINANGALGTYTLAAIYGALLVSNVFLPVVMIR